MTIKITTLVAPTNTNIQKAFESIKQYAVDKGYQIKGELKEETLLDKFKNFFSENFFDNDCLQFDSKSQAKACKTHLTRLEQKVCMREANIFLHFLYKKVYKLNGTVPYVTYGEQELKIQEIKKKWNAVRLEAEKLRLEYKKIKGDFYKK